MVQQAPWTLCYHPSPKGLVWKNSDGWSLSSNLGHSWRTQRLQKSKLLKVLLVNLPTFCSRRKTLPLLSSKGYKSVLTLRKKSKLKSQFTIFQGCSYNNILKKKKKKVQIMSMMRHAQTWQVHGVLSPKTINQYIL